MSCSVYRVHVGETNKTTLCLPCIGFFDPQNDLVISSFPVTYRMYHTPCMLRPSKWKHIKDLFLKEPQDHSWIESSPEQEVQWNYFPTQDRTEEEDKFPDSPKGRESWGSSFLYGYGFRWW